MPFSDPARPIIVGDPDADVTAPAVPTGLAVVAGEGEAVLDWDDNPEIDLANYRVYIATSAGGPFTHLASPTGSSYVATGLTASTQYWFAVSAIDEADNESELSTAVDDTTDPPVADTTPPAVPTGLTAAGGYREVTLDWDNSPSGDFASFNVKRGPTGGPYTTIATVTASNYVDGALADATTYYYVVSAVDTSGNESANSSQVSAVTADEADTTPPAVPTGLSATGGAGQIVLNWADNAEPDLAFYRVYRSFTSGGTYTQIATRTVSAYTVTGLNASTQYWFKVAAEDTSGNLSAQTAFATATTDAPIVDVIPPAAPTGLTATGGANQVTLNWADNTEPDLASYRVKRATVNGGPYTLVATRSISNYVDLGLAASTTYYYRVSAVDTTGNESVNSSQASATTTAVVVTPGGFPPPEAPRIVVNENYPASPSITLSPGATIETALVAGHRIIKLNPGSYGNQQLNPRHNSYIYCQTGVAVFDGGSVVGRPFITGGTSASNVTLRGLEVKWYFTTFQSASLGVIHTPRGSTGWKFIQMNVWGFNNTGFRLRGSGHHLINTKVHDGTMYAFTDGLDHTIRGCEFYRLCVRDGTQIVPVTEDTDRGVCKIVGGTSSWLIEDCHLWDVYGNGFWFDGSRSNGIIRRIKGVNVERSIAFVEVSYGPWLIEDIDAIGGAKGIGGTNIDYPSHGVVAASLTPDVTFKRVRGRNVGIGIQLLNSSSHPALDHGYPGQNLSAAEVVPNLGLARCVVEDIDIQASRFAIGFTGDAHSDYPATQDPHVTIRGVQLYSAHPNPQYGVNPSFRWGGTFPMSLSQWNNFTHTFLTK